MQQFDESSQSVFRNWAVCSTVLSMLVLLPWWIGGLPLNEVIASFSTAFHMAALVTMLGAVRRGEHVGEGPLNGWDQSIAFNGLATLGHMFLGSAS